MSGSRRDGSVLRARIGGSFLCLAMVVVFAGMGVADPGATGTLDGSAAGSVAGSAPGTVAAPTAGSVAGSTTGGAVAFAAVSPRLQAAFKFSPSAPVIGQVVTFDAGSSTCPDAPCTYAWSYQSPDYTHRLGVGQVVRVAFQRTGTKDISLSITDESGDTSTVDENVVVTATGPPSGPVAAFTYTPSDPVSGDPVTFDASDSECSDDPCTYTWSDDGPDGPDGANWPLGAGEVLNFTFRGTGTKYVRLTVNDASGETSTIEHDVVVDSAGSGGGGGGGGGTPSAPTNTVAPQITGTPQQGQTLTASTGTWTGGPTGYTYAWSDGGTGRTDTLDAADVGKTLTVTVTATNSGGSASATSPGVGPVTAPPPAAPDNTAAPTVSGTATQGSMLTTSNGSWSNSPTRFTYAWQDCNASGASCSDISGATASSYTLVASDVGHTVQSVVTASNAGGSSSASSDPTSTIAAASTGGGGSGGGGGGGGTTGSTTQKNCAAMSSNNQPSPATLDACGYPSPNTTGVPAGVTLTPVASANLPAGASWSGNTLTISGDNVTVSGLSINGTVSISGSNDTLTDSKIVAGDGADLVLVHGTSGNTISNSEIDGESSTSNSGFCGRAIHMAGSVSVTVDHVQVANCADGVVGISHTTNSYIYVNVVYCGAGATGAACSHDEPIYLPGGNGSVSQTIEHNTLLNAMNQVAGVFGDDHAYGPLSNVTINGNLVADQASNGAITTGKPGDGNKNIVVTNNRLSYIYGANMPAGGSDPASTTWTNNYRDDTLALVPMTNGQ